MNSKKIKSEINNTQNSLTPDQIAFAKAWKSNQDQEEIIEAINKDYVTPHNIKKFDTFTGSYYTDKSLEVFTGKKYKRLSDLIIDFISPYSNDLLTWGIIIFVLLYILLK